MKSSRNKSSSVSHTNKNASARDILSLAEKNGLTVFRAMEIRGELRRSDLGDWYITIDGVSRLIGKTNGTAFANLSIFVAIEQSKNKPADLEPVAIAETDPAE